jgi:hypothetical protein
MRRSYPCRLGEPGGNPHPPTEMLLPFVRWLYGIPSPNTAPYCLLPNMSESSGTPGQKSPGFSRFICAENPQRLTARSRTVGGKFVLSKIAHL